ncbi:DUF4238 domain-containing protein [Pedobacter sp.]|jgi:hypothetical protein|uniref:DUF4238 domain-containing protein n=1 Tax=Pedobacter sp. TaxID=1411316 RepID=UPI002BA3A038|nr:DUF4238 domain-containing protein [Pedobacter sp.]HWW37729.1 DUF4238 domain-containing protein [Pedobacter sp.]
MNQHFVPRVYLRNFANRRGDEYFVDVFDTKLSRYFNANIKKVCSETDFYTLEEGNRVARDLFAIEKIYGNGIEPLYKKSYDILTNPNIRFISELQRAEIIMGLFQFYIRNPRLLNRSLAHHKAQILKLCREANSSFKKGITYLDIDFSFREYTTEGIMDYFEKLITKTFKEQHISRIDEIGSFHIDVKFEVAMIREDDSEFITSDNPLALQDLISNDENPLERSKEFIISLNKKTAIRLYHDNSKRRDEVRRHWIPNLSVTMHNNTVREQASRFLITNRETNERNQQQTDKFLNDTSAEAKINMIRQVLAIFPETNENRDSHAVLIEYLKKYEQNGTLTDQEQHEMILKTREIQNKFLRRRITL